jgi:hypothetical protein
MLFEGGVSPHRAAGVICGRCNASGSPVQRALPTSMRHRRGLPLSASASATSSACHLTHLHSISTRASSVQLVLAGGLSAV